MAFNRTDYIVIGVLFSGLGIFVVDDLALPQAGSWWVLGDVGIGLALAAIVAAAIVSTRRQSVPKKT